MKKFFVILFTVFALLLISCEAGSEEPYVQFDEAAYWEAKEKWLSLNSKNYNFSYVISSDATGPNYPEVVVTVVDGSASYELVAETEDDKNRFDDNDACFISAEYLFEFIWDLYEEAKKTVDAKPDGLVSKIVDVQYDQKLGFPLFISSYGSWKEKASIGGGWWSMKINNIEVD